MLPPPKRWLAGAWRQRTAGACAQVRDMTGRGEVTKRRVKEGVGEFPVDCPLEDCAVRVHFTARAVGSEQVGYPNRGTLHNPQTASVMGCPSHSLRHTVLTIHTQWPRGVGGLQQVVYDTRGPEGASPPLEFSTGMNEVPEAVDMAVRLMTPQETSLVRAQPRYAYAGRDDRPPVCHAAAHCFPLHARFPVRSGSHCLCTWSCFLVWAGACCHCLCIPALLAVTAEGGR